MAFYNIPDTRANGQSYLPGRNRRLANNTETGNHISLRNMNHAVRATSEEGNPAAGEVGWRDMESQEAIFIVAQGDTGSTVKTTPISAIQSISVQE